MSALACGVIVPCRDEAEVIGRRLANLARLDWPAGARHRVVVVDDGSRDGTAEAARAGLAALAALGVDARLVGNDVRPGKNGAIEAGLTLLGDAVEVVVLTDADVVTSRSALVALERALAADPRLGMVSGAQTFVRGLADDGRAPGEEDAPLVDAGEAWDRVTARVRRLESRAGRLFSVHGQWLAWRADLGLAPGAGVAADDVDLMLRARASARPRVALVGEARFFEEKPRGAGRREEQALRRARAWFQVFGAVERPPLAGLDAAQAWLYGRLPGLLPELALAAGLLATAGATAAGGLPGALLALLAIGGAAATGPGREWGRLLAVIARARRAERRSAMGERWESARG